MKMVKTGNGGGCFELLKLTALILTIITVLTLPLAASKYAATGTGSAVARIAKWAPDLSSNTGYANRSVVLHYRPVEFRLKAANSWKTSSSGKSTAFLYWNESEVTAEYSANAQPPRGSISFGTNPLPPDPNGTNKATATVSFPYPGDGTFTVTGGGATLAISAGTASVQTARYNLKATQVD